MSEILQKIGDVIRDHGTFLVVSHKDPDGDAIGSSLALYRLLKEMDKVVYVENPTHPLPRIYSFLEDFDKVKPISNSVDVEVVFVVDTADMPRCGLSEEYIKDRLVVNIDHHKTNTKFGDINLIEPEAAAVGCILWRLFTANGFDISKATATYLYVSLLTDTGSFRYASTTPETFRISAELLERGVEPWYVAYNIYETMELKVLKLLGLVLGTLETYHDGKLAIEYVTREMFEKTGTGREDSEGFVNYARGVYGAEVGALLREDGENFFKISLRSKSDVDVSKVAALFGGGGHKNAAGCEIEGSLEEVKKKLVDAFSFLREQN